MKAQIIVLAAVLASPAAAQSASSNQENAVTPTLSSPERGGLVPANIPEATKDIHQDAGAGMYQPEAITDIGDANALRTTLKIVSVHPDPEWLSRVQIALIAGTADRGSIQLLLENPNNGRFKATLLRYKDRKLQATSDFGVEVAPGQPIDIAMDWTADGTAIVHLGSAPPVKASLGLPITRFEVVSSSCGVALSPFLLAHAN